MAITFDGAPSSQALANYGQRLIPFLTPQATQQQPAQAAQVQQPSSQDTINQATEAGAQQAAAQHAQAQSINNAVQRGAQLQQGLLGGVPQSQNPNEQMVLEFQRGLLGYKDQWAKAQAAGDQQGMTDAAAGANVLRDYAQKQGINLDNYYGGADNTRAQLAASIDAQNDSRYGRLLSSPDSATYYDQVYNDAIANGASRRVAQRYAGQQAQKYQAQRMADLSLALQDRGISHQGFLNSQGAQILAMMYDENPNGVAQVYNSYFGKPVNLGTWELAETSADNADKRQRGQMTLTEQLNELLSNNNTANSMKLQDQQIGYNKWLAEKQDALERDKIASTERMSYHKDDSSVAAASVKGTSGSGGSGGGSKSSSDGSKGSGSDSTALSIMKAYDEWNSNHPGEEWANPYKDASDKAQEQLSDYKPAPDDVDDYSGVYSWAQDVLEENARRGYPATAEQLAQAIASVGGYGQQIAQELADSGALSQYGR